MSRKKVEIPRPEDPQLDALACHFRGLRKLVPSTNWGAPPFSEYGFHNSPHNAWYDETAQNYAEVSIVISYHASEGWDCCVSISDGDDGLFQIWRKLTIENWQQMMDLYNSIDGVDCCVCDMIHHEFGLE